MSVIRRLPSQVIDHIAAGEVIERPASVVKELLENAVDAGADAIEVTVEGGGLDRIEVTDNGRGMSPADADLCLERHATSKLFDAGDLLNISTLGFRGEALSSIASVSRLRVTTRRAEDAVATRIEVEAGVRLSRTQIGAPPGTTFEIRDLFFNTPARRKYLRAPSTEQTHVVRACQRVLLGAPGRGLVVRTPHRRLLHLPRGADESHRVSQALGRDVDELYSFTGERDGVGVRGFIAPPHKARRDARGIWIFVNGRYVRDGMLQRALLDGCSLLFERGRYPVVALYLEVHASAAEGQTSMHVDVNVHPQKTEVRFADGRNVFRAVAAVVTTAVGELGLPLQDSPGSSPPALNPHFEATRDAVARYYGRTQGGASLGAAHSFSDPAESPHPGAGPTQGGPTSSVGTPPAFHSAGDNGMVYRSGAWLWITRETRLWLVHLPRLVADLMQAILDQREPANPRPLVLPVVVDTALECDEWLRRCQDALEDVGLASDSVGPRRIAISAAPLVLHRIDCSSLLVRLVRSLDDDNDDPVRTIGDFPWRAEILAAGYRGGTLDAVHDLDCLLATPAAEHPSMRLVDEEEAARLWSGAAGPTVS